MAKYMTQGKIAPQLVGFTIPLVLGNVFQLMYNAVDSVIVGKYVGDSALAAVGTSGPIMNVAILLISGLCMGASILMSTQYGAKDYDALSRQISTTLIGGVLFSVLFSLAMLILSPYVLKLIQVPNEMIVEATSYLRIIFMGLMFTFIYNFLANTLRALGDSKTPLFFLIMSAIINVFGDLIFVLVFKMGVHGSAISTVISEAFCCLGCAIYIKVKVPLLCLGRKWFVFDKSMFLKTISYGGTSAMQQVCLQVGKIIIQAMVNTQGVGVIAAFAAVNRVDDFAYTPQQNIGHAMTTFIAQNRGAKKEDRIKAGFKCGLLIELIYSIGLFFVIFFLSNPIMRLFVKNESVEVVALGVSYLHLIALMYILPGLTNGIQGFFRGMGDLKITLYSTFMNMFGRVVAVIIFLKVFEMPFNCLAWANMAGWIVMMLFEVPLLMKSLKSIDVI